MAFKAMCDATGPTTSIAQLSSSRVRFAMAPASFPTLTS
eukprot:CAMPEP_0169391658 /NCGR_PEP_ID=MMETSP1017-20121227/48192_1 /TAXON_ID=342587 /ORGANISM="Karlodinium micrum, Strain CCMP2283" /LENGTH=38 /DNA_ID= /DNA_START= /DNA_END= /DNA_ORIENTATION=